MYEVRDVWDSLAKTAGKGKDRAGGAQEKGSQSSGGACAALEVQATATAWPCWELHTQREKEREKERGSCVRGRRQVGEKVEGPPTRVGGK